MVWVVDLGVQITDEERTLYIGSFNNTSAFLSIVQISLPIKFSKVNNAYTIFVVNLVIRKLSSFLRTRKCCPQQHFKDFGEAELSEKEIVVDY